MGKAPHKKVMADSSEDGVIRLDFSGKECIYTGELPQEGASSTGSGSNSEIFGPKRKPTPLKAPKMPVPIDLRVHGRNQPESLFDEDVTQENTHKSFDQNCS